MECKKCKMDKGLAGQGFTPFICEKCGKRTYHHNTNIPKFCDECSKKYNICEKCGVSLGEEEEEKQNKSWK